MVVTLPLASAREQTVSKRTFFATMRRLANFILALTILLAIYLLLFHKSLIQSYNLNMLLADGYGGRLLTHRVNSLGQLDEILDSGVRAFEVDLYFIDSPSGGRFAVGHNKEELSDLALAACRRTSVHDFL